RIAARANEIVARTVGWCLDDGRPRAAVEIVEAGRSLVLASVVLAGQVEEVLRGAGQHTVADGWRHGAARGRAAGLNALWDTRHGQSLLATPTADEVSAIPLRTAAINAVVYLVPPPPSDAPGSVNESGPAAAPPGRALLVRPGFGSRVEVVELPGMVTGAGTPLAGYLEAFGAALEGQEPTRRHPEGFRGSPGGRVWADAPAELGWWPRAPIVGPLVEHIRGWSLDGTPHLALVPLGELAAIPYAAAWMEDPTVPGGRRYAVHDLVLTQAVSARLLGELTRRPR